MQHQDILPSGVCSSCYLAAAQAANFLTFYREASKQWDAVLDLLQNIPDTPTRESLFVIIKDGLLILVDDETKNISSTKKAAEKLTSCLAPVPISKTYYKRYSCQCPTCGKKFQYPQYLFQHLKESPDLKRACPVCADIMNRNDLVTHLSEVHGKEPNDCKLCPAMFRSPQLHAKHLIEAHAPGACICGDCGRSFSSNHAYRAHLSIHALKTCPGCDRTYRNQACYMYHVKKCCNLDKNRQDTYRTKHKVMFEVKNEKSERRVKVGLRGSTDNECFCDYCGKKFAGKKFVAAHIQIVHMKNTHRPCAQCGKLLASAHMSEHMKSHDTREYKCEHCGIVLKTKLGYVQHIRLHTGEKPYACKHCGETFSASSRRSEHIRKCHSSEVVLRHACKLCPARFQLPYKLKKHVTSVHDQDDSSTLFECNECHEKFGSCRGLLHHSRKHQKITPSSKIEFKVYSHGSNVIK